MEEIQKAMEVKFAELKKQVEEKTSGVTSEEFTALETKHNEMVTELAEAKSKDQTDVTIKAMQEHLDKLDIKMQKNAVGTVEEKSFVALFDKMIVENKTSLRDMVSKKDAKTMMVTKAVGDMDTTNFSGDSLTVSITEFRPNVKEDSFNPIWLRQLMPNNTTQGSTIHYIKETGGAGAAGVWDGSALISVLPDKPGVDYTFDSVTGNVIWIAGITRLKREMLDDVAWLRGYLSRKLITGKRGLFVAENTQILSVLNANATAYDGDKTILVEAIYDAAFGQLVENYHRATAIVVDARDLVNEIALNKAVGSGEYDLPNGTVTMVNGQLSIGGIPVVGLPGFGADKFMVFDGNETEFISRMSPEVRFFEEDKDNVHKNLVTVRVEERILPIVYDNTAVITGDLTPPV